MNKTTRRILLVLLWILLIPLSLIVALVIALQFPGVQQFAAQKATGYLAETLKTEVSIGRFTTDWRNSLVLKEIYLEDQKGDTLIYAERLGVDLNIFGLLNSKINISSAKLDNAVLNISATMPDSVYNFDFIMAAFATDTTVAQPSDTAAAFTYKIGSIELNNIRFAMNDQVTGNIVKAKIGHLKTGMETFDPDKAIYVLGNTTLENSYANVLQTKVSDTPSDSLAMDFDFGQINLKNIQLNYENKVAAQRILLDVKASEIASNDIDLKNAKIDLAKFDLQNAAFAYYQDKTVPTDSLAVNPVETAAKLDSVAAKHQGAPANWVVKLGNLNLANVTVDFGNYNTPETNKGMDFNHLKFTGINVAADDLYYSENKIAAALKQLQLQEKSGFKITNFQADIDVDSTRAAFHEFDLKTGHSHLRPEFALGYPSLATIADNVDKITIDADLENSVIGAQDILYFAPYLADNPSFQKIAGRSLTIDGRLYGKVEDLNAENLRVKGLAGTSINVSGNIKEMTNIENGALNLNINEFTTTRTDLLALLPAGTIPKDITLPERMTISGRIRGRMNDLELQNFRAAASGGTLLVASGTIRNATDPKKLRMNLDVNNFTSTRSALVQMLPKGTIPPDIQLPEKMQVSGKFNGSLEDFTTNANIKTSFGNAVANVKMQPGERFSGTASLAEFNLGKLLKQEATLGTATGRATFQGTGLSPETMRATFSADVQKIVYNKYAYNNIHLEGTVDRNVYAVTGNMKDQNLAFNLNGNFNLNGARPTYKATLNLDGANLKALNFYPEDLRVQGRIVADLSGASPNDMKGTISVSNLLMRKANRNYRSDTMAIQLNNSPGRTDVAIQSDIVTGFFRGNNSVSDLPTALMKHFDSYFNFQDEPFPANLTLQDFDFNFDLKRPRIFTAFVPGLRRIRPGFVKGNYTVAGKNLNIDASLPRLIYQNYTIDSTLLELRGDAEKIGYNLQTKRLQDSTLLIRNLSLGGNVQNNTIATRLNIAEDNGDSRFALGGIMNTIPNGYRFSFTPGEVIINREPWNVAEDNYLQYQNGNIFARNVRLGKNGSELLINSLGTNTANAPLEVRFTNFDLAYLSRAVERTDSLVAGNVNGNLVLRDITGNLGFTSDLTITNLAYTGNPVGNISLQASSAAGGRYNLLATLTGNGNNATVNGYFVANGTSNNLNLTADIASLNLAAIQGFSAGQLENVSGNLNGRLSITGTMAQPVIRGETTFNNAAFAITMYNSVYRLPNESIVFDERGLNFSDFTVLDSAGNKAVMNGTIFTQNYTDFSFGLTATTKNFLLINSTAGDYKLYYGRLIVDSDIRIRGDLNLPVVTADVKVVEGSHMTMVIPSEEAAKQEQEGIVQFVNLHRRRPNSMMMEERQDSVQEMAVTGIDVHATVQITDKTLVSVIMDEAAGDILEVTGNGTLNAGIDPAGNITLTGRYDMNGGSYKLHFYDIASRELNIGEGSSITWYGDPLQANLDIKAIYNVKAPVRELVADQIVGESGTEQNKYRQVLPFLVYVNLRGDMLKPEITFDIQLPEEERAAFGGQIDQRLQMLRQEPAEMNKQVFSLIVLNRFMAPDPLQSSGGGLEQTARNSISGALSDQLNKLTNRYAGGLGLELGLNTYQDYSTGDAQNRTDLNVAVRQQFLNDRLIFRVGTDIGVEGRSPNSQQNQRSGFTGNFSVEYLILPDGRLRVRGFQQPSYELLTESEVLETGVALVYQRDYNSFADLFKRVSKAQREAKQ
ncbi:translocation/assembly module TamB domain-containing protein [Adhaeribacter soli]|uniref:Translocation and assembly module TamB C-terminal domain-containing protein n=1 Tax=Adhaeribacter soli TaxID=2607655 RepID=A0A5N1J575_9BACT|nr:translocation/assembly module TamB domain-containing protein [Adhaeribacter soli]KAA9345854.1 hypothetical protein F0P94_01870 [Adhaeribacter soli]